MRPSGVAGSSPRYRCVCLLGPWLAALLLGARPAAAEEMRWTLGDWCPFVCVETAGEPQGIMPEIARTVLGEHGISLTYVPAPYTRAIELVRSGQVDIVVTTREDTPDLIFPAIEQGMTGNTFFVKAESAWRYKDERSLESLHKLGTVQSYNYLELRPALARNRDKLDELTGSDVTRRCIRKLLAGRFDAFIYDGAIVEYELRRMGLATQIVAAGSLRDPLPVYIALSPKRPQSRRRAEWLAQGMQTLRRSGALAQILARYGVQDWRPRDGSGPQATRP